MTALIFPGQGTQRPGMGTAFHRFPEAAAVIAAAGPATGTDMAVLLRRGPAHLLRDTGNAQPAVTTVNLAALAVLRARQITYDLVAGHSVGALAALVAADVLPERQVLWLAARRGALMSALPAGGSMVSVSGLTAAEAAPIVAAVCRAGTVVIGLVNGACRVVLSGESPAVTAATGALLAAGAQHATPLAVSHAFHSPLMAPALPAWRDTVATLPLRPAVVPVLSDLTGEPLTAPRDLRDYLVDQLAGPVRWDLVCARLTAAGPRTAIEVGDSRVLRSYGHGCAGLSVIGMAQPHNVSRLYNGEPLIADLPRLTGEAAPTAGRIA
ncbi:ACP S-malonyltransferase [Actinoplanes sp. NPDC004185]